MKAKEAIRVIKAKQAELAEQMKHLSTEAFNEESKEIFEKHPSLTSFAWTQYTPYFNDGDECHFSAHTDELDFVFGEEEFNYVGRWDVKKNEFSEEHSSAMAEVLEFMTEFDSEQLEVLFGDHAKVCVSRDGTHTREYEHD